MESLKIFLALGAIGCSSGFLISFLIEFLLPIISINISKSGDSALFVALIIVATSRIFIGSGFELKFMITIGLTVFMGYYLFLLIKK